MSTGSVASDAEDFHPPCRRRTTVASHPGRVAGHNSIHYTHEDDEMEEGEAEEEEEEEEDFSYDARGGKAKHRAQAQAQATARQLSKAPAQREGRRGQRSAANARERARMQVLSSGFSRLKTSLPWVPADTKLSKLDTLRLASSYISHLRRLLQDERLERGFVHPVNLTWPFVMSGRLEEQEDNNNNNNNNNNNMSSSAGRTLCGASA